MQKTKLKRLLLKSLQSYRYAKVNYLTSKLLDDYEGMCFRNVSVSFVDSFQYASQMSTLLTVLNLFDDEGKSDSKFKRETMTFDWYLRQIALIMPFNEKLIKAIRKRIYVTNHSRTMLKAIKLRNKYYAHLDTIFFTHTTSNHLISYEQFDIIINKTEDIFNYIYAMLFKNEQYDFNEIYSDFDQIIKIVNKEIYKK